MKKFILVSLLVVLFAAQGAFGQTNVKVGPDGDTFGIFPAESTSHAAGYLIRLHVTDATEVAAIGVQGLLHFGNAAVFTAISSSQTFLFQTWYNPATLPDSGTGLTKNAPVISITVFPGTPNDFSTFDDLGISHGPIVHFTAPVNTPETVTPGRVFGDIFRFPSAQAAPTSTVRSSTFTTGVLSFVNSDLAGFLTSNYNVGVDAPEPGSLTMLGAGLGCLLLGLGVRRRRRRS